MTLFLLFSGRLYGIPISTGHVDFWPNSGKTLQPVNLIKNVNQNNLRITKITKKI